MNTCMVCGCGEETGSLAEGFRMHPIGLRPPQSCAEESPGEPLHTQCPQGPPGPPDCSAAAASRGRAAQVGQLSRLTGSAPVLPLSAFLLGVGAFRSHSVPRSNLQQQGRECIVNTPASAFGGTLRYLLWVPRSALAEWSPSRLQQ